MKRIFILTVILSLLWVGCEVHPYADFLADRRSVQPYEQIMFTNLSERSTSFQWDFGDGTVTDIPNPVHTYTEEGYYTVTLTAFSKDGNRDVATMEIEVFYTELEITVAEWNPAEEIEYIVPGAYVILYETLDDWYYDEFAVVWGNADEHGMISFIGLESRSYYVWAEADDIAVQGDHYDNYQFYDDNLIDYIATPVLVPYVINPWITWVDYYPPYKSAQKRKDKYDADKIKRIGDSFLVPDVSK
ncbi:MAG: PKD domain-containing protein [Bacteroidales bacterium]